MSSEEAANIYFATISTPTGNTVDHIDIGITAKASVTVPLAYGNYYDESGTLVLNVPQGTYINSIGVNDNVNITQADIMSAMIKSYTKGSNGNTPVNSFVINNYSTSWGTLPNGDRIDQVRMGGVFPVGTKNNQIYYEVEVNKDVELSLTYNGKELYDVDGNPLKVTINTSLAASFGYWDEDNGCPGLNIPEWQNGNVSYSNSGMDFVLGTTDDNNSKVTAVEIVKSVVDENGIPINLSSHQILVINLMYIRIHLLV